MPGAMPGFGGGALAQRWTLLMFVHSHYVIEHEQADAEDRLPCRRVTSICATNSDSVAR